MKTDKIYILIFAIVLMLLVLLPFINSTPLNKKIQNDNLINKIRDTDTIREKGGNGNYKSYNSAEKKLFIKDKNNNPLINITLTSPYTTYVSAGESVKVAEFLLNDYNKKGSKLFDKMYFFDRKNKYNEQTRDYTFKYGTDYIEEVCQLLPELEEEVEYCQNMTKTNWTEFSILSELPHKNIKIGLFTDTILGDKVEWIPNIKGFDILEWAAWDVTSGESHEFDTNGNTADFSLAKIDSTHYLNVYESYIFPNSFNYAIVLTVNQTDWTVTSGAKHEFDDNRGGSHSLIQLGL